MLMHVVHEPERRIAKKKCDSCWSLVKGVLDSRVGLPAICAIVVGDGDVAEQNEVKRLI